MSALKLIVTPGSTRGPAFQRSRQQSEHILPVRIRLLDQVELPFATPPLDPLFMFNAGDDIVTPICSYQSGQTITDAKVGAVAGAMLMDSCRDNDRP